MNFMESYPHCNEYYDEANDTQPCCGGCGQSLTSNCWANNYDNNLQILKVSHDPT